jgi:hypothetical protein
MFFKEARAKPRGSRALVMCTYSPRHPKITLRPKHKDGGGIITLKMHKDVVLTKRAWIRERATTSVCA